MTREVPPGKPAPRSPTLRHAASRLRRAPSARRQDDGRAELSAGSATEQLLGRYHSRVFSCEQMKRTETVTARIPIAADPMLGAALVRELTQPFFSLSTGAFPWDAEPPGRGKKVGNWFHRHYILGQQDVYARLHRRYVLFDDLDEDTWQLVGTARALHAALRRVDVVKAGHLDEPALLATANATLWDVAQRCARLTSLRRAREHAGSYDVGGVLPAQAIKQTSQVLANARAALDRPMDNLEELAGHVLEADDHYRAWRALQELVGRCDNFADLAVAYAADAHHGAAWCGHYAQARATAATLAASISATGSFLAEHGLATDG